MFLGRITNELKTQRQLGKLRQAVIIFIQLPQAHLSAEDPGSVCHTK